MESLLNAPKYSLCVLRQSSGFTISVEIILSILILGISTLAQGVSSNLLGQSKRVVIAASAVLDGKGHVLHDTRIVIEGSQIAAIDPKAGPVDYDLRGLTVLPGWIDAHVTVWCIFAAAVLLFLALVILCFRLLMRN